MKSKFIVVAALLMLAVFIIVVYLTFFSFPRRRPLKNQLQQLHKLPVYWLNQILTEEENQHLRNIAQSKLKRSMVEGDKVVPQRTSSSAILDEDDVTLAIKRRLADICNYPIENFEPLQVVHYDAGQEYKPHHDYLYGWTRERRHVTFFIYLNGDDEVEGGETEFTSLGFKVNPRRNAGLMWYNVKDDGSVEPLTLHAGLPPKKGEKWGLNVWVKG